MFEVPTCDEPQNDKKHNGSDNLPNDEPKNDEQHNGSDNLLNDSEKSSDHTPDVPEHKQEHKDDEGHEGSGNYNNMEDFVKYTIRNYLGENYEFDSMSDETEQQLYEMFCDMNIHIT